MPYVQVTLSLSAQTEAQFLARGPQEGLCAIMDMTNMCFSHLWRFPLPLVSRFIGMIQEGMPVRLKEIHIVNCSYFLPTLMSFLKPFMKKELADLVRPHSGEPSPAAAGDYCPLTK